MKRFWQQAREAVPIIWRWLTSGNVDRFERETRAFRGKHGIGGEPPVQRDMQGGKR